MFGNNKISRQGIIFAGYLKSGSFMDLENKSNEKSEVGLDGHFEHKLYFYQLNPYFLL